MIIYSQQKSASSYLIGKTNKRILATSAMPLGEEHRFISRTAAGNRAYATVKAKRKTNHTLHQRVCLKILALCEISRPVNGHLQLLIVFSFTALSSTYTG